MNDAAPDGADGDTPDIETGRWLFAQPCEFLRGVVELGGRAAVPSDSESGRTAVVSDDQGVSCSLSQPAPGF